ncbi:lysosome-associated membrane glycoprotein 5-like [Limulus polyphemus]|uniref:Lysosome-associated membrane glycoprotein 5-like n=1 Tax=Limulus polyphemus TaxID=6850 RepID=A0ABM1BFE4_LIMPO|nr:lysosome-associated membrane glycoprotein 5-like [Limulus polyphemus]
MLSLSLFFQVVAASTFVYHELEQPLRIQGGVDNQFVTDGIGGPDLLEDDVTLTTKDTVSPPSPNTPPGLPKQPAPEFAFPVWDSDGNLCLLGKFSATFAITYTSQGGDQTISVKLPEQPTTKGRCGTSDQDPVLELSWPGFRFSMIFTKTLPTEKDGIPSWSVISLELLYNTAGPLFPGATNGGKKTARSADNTTLFETPFGKSYFCPSPEVIPLYDSKRNKVTIVRLHDVQLQPYDVKNGVFSAVQRCSQVKIGGMVEPFSQDETVPIAVGSTLAVMAILVVLGYAIYRSVMVRRVDYTTME